MKQFIAFILAFTSFFLLANGQNVGTQPACVQDSFNTVLATPPGGCTTTDFKCLCKSSSFITAIQTEIDKECTAVVDQQSGINFGISTCALLGIKVSVPGVTNAFTMVASSATLTTAPLSTSTTSPSGSNAIQVPLVGAFLGLGITITFL